MAIDRVELGRRLRVAREAVGLTQESVAQKMGLARATVTQMELGNREVTSFELDRLAYLYARDMRSFFAAEFEQQDALTVLFRAHPEIAGDEIVAEALRKTAAFGRELSNLESILHLSAASFVPAVYPLGSPKTKGEAIRQGEGHALEERRRLDLGDGALGDITEVLESQGVRTAELPLPDDVSGMTISDREAGILVAVNENHPEARRRFSCAHEYAHVIFDRDRSSLVSTWADREEHLEVRANAFAASFLAPEPGVQQFMAGLGKGRRARMDARLYDEREALAVRQRIPAETQKIQVYDVLLLANHFGVSPATALFRLRNIQPAFINDEELAALKAQLESPGTQELRRALAIPEPEEAGGKRRKGSTKHFLALAMEAYRRDEISRGKFLELAAMVEVGRQDAVGLCERLGPDAGGE